METRPTSSFFPTALDRPKPCSCYAATRHGKRRPALLLQIPYEVLDLSIPLSMCISMCIYLSLHQKWRVWRVFVHIVWDLDASLGFVLKNASLLTSCNSRGQFTARIWLQHELAENIWTRNRSALISLSRSQDLYFLENATHPCSALREQATARVPYVERWRELCAGAQAEK